MKGTFAFIILRDWSLLMPGNGRKEFERGIKIFKRIGTNFWNCSWGMKNPQDIHKEIHIILSVTSIKISRSLCRAVKISLIRKVKKFLIFSLEITICIEKCNSVNISKSGCQWRNINNNWHVVGFN